MQNWIYAVIFFAIILIAVGIYWWYKGNNGFYNPFSSTTSSVPDDMSFLDQNYEEQRLQELQQNGVI